MKILGHYVYAPIAGLAAAEFAVAAGSLAFASIIVGGHNAREGGVLASSLGFALAILGGLTAMGLYQTKQRLTIEGVLARILVGVGLAAVLLALVNFFFQLEIERRLWVATFVLAAILLGVVRVVFWRWVEEQEMFQRHVLVYGAGKLAGSLLKLRRRSDRRGFNIVAFVRADGDERSFEDPRVVRIPTSLLDYAVGAGVDEIVVAMDDRRLARVPVRRDRRRRAARVPRARDGQGQRRRVESVLADIFRGAADSDAEAFAHENHRPRGRRADARDRAAFHGLHRDGDPARRRRPGALSADARRLHGQIVHALQVSEHGQGRGGVGQPAVGCKARLARDARRRVAA